MSREPLTPWEHKIRAAYAAGQRERRGRVAVLVVGVVLGLAMIGAAISRADEPPPASINYPLADGWIVEDEQGQVYFCDLAGLSWWIWSAEGWAKSAVPLSIATRRRIHGSGMAY